MCEMLWSENLIGLMSSSLSSEPRCNEVLLTPASSGRNFCQDLGRGLAAQVSTGTGELLVDQTR